MTVALTPSVQSPSAWALNNLPNSATASKLGILDAGNYYSSVTVEGALAEAGAYVAPYTGAASRQKISKLSDFVCVKDFGSNVGAGLDDTAAFQAALATGKTVYVPAGNYKANIVATDKLVMRGDGSNATFITPFNAALATFIYRAKSPYWTYHSEISNLCFLSAAKVGVGFSFARTSPGEYVVGDEYCNNVVFRGVNFQGFNKAFQAPFGNIGCEFYSCGFHANKYGVYTIDNKFGGDGMHAGNKYFRGGEMSGNECAVYCHNAADGFGGLDFDDVIFEANNVNTYIYTTNAYIPPVFRHCWCENSGSVLSTANVTLDVWTGSALSTAAFAPHTHIFDGGYYMVTFSNGRITDFHLKGTQICVTAVDCAAEQDPGVGAAKSVVSDINSTLRLVRPLTSKGVPNTDGVVLDGAWRNRSSLVVSSNTFDSISRVAIVTPRYNRQSGFGSMSNSIAMPLTVASTVGNGSFGPILGTAPSDGVIYPTCNEWIIPFTSTSQLMQIVGSAITTAAGYYVATLDVKAIAGTPTIYLWDRGAAQAGQYAVPAADGIWRTIAVLAYSSGGQTLYFDIGNSAVSTTIRCSALQIKRFATIGQAEAFLNSQIYVSS